MKVPKDRVILREGEDPIKDFMNLQLRFEKLTSQAISKKLPKSGESPE